MRSCFILVITLVLLGACGPAWAGITVEQTAGVPVPQGAATVEFNPKTGGWDIHLLQLYNMWGDTVFNIVANGGEVINNVFIDVEGPAAGSPVIVRLYSAAPGGLDTVHNIIQNGSAEVLLNAVYTTNDIGAIQVLAIGDLFAGRDIIGPIIATTPNSSARGINTAQAQRHILGNLSAENGRITQAIAVDGNIGSADNPVSIRAKNRIMLVMGNDVYASIETRVNGGTGGFWALIADRFHGSLDTEKLIFNSSNNVDGLIVITQEFGGILSIGKAFNSPTQYIELPVAGLTGQIVINADNAPGATWTSPIRLGPQGDPQQIVLTGPGYSYSSEQLGGGSIGLTPFGLHEQSCTPGLGQTAFVLPDGEPLTVKLKHYGPVTWAQGAAPVTIERRQAGSSAPFTAAPATQFAFSSPAEGANTLAIGPSASGLGFAIGYEYRIKPTPALRCAVAAQPQVVWSHDYLITVLAPPCDGDVNASYMVNVDDLFIVIALWGQSPSLFPAADINDDGQIGIDDLFIVISAWGPCW